uniref:Uncharacterized protein n=1 Tax=Anguilla anguilla TaxID=7936 RepID=A0A0E9XGZ9_ANGAN
MKLTYCLHQYFLDGVWVV